MLTLLAVGLCVLMERQRGYRLEFYYRAALLFCLCGVTATGVAASSGIVGEAGIVFVPYVMVYVGYSLVSAVMWPLALGYAFMRRAAALRVFCPVLAGQFLGQFAGFLAVEAMEQTRLVGKRDRSSCPSCCLPECSSWGLPTPRSSPSEASYRSHPCCLA